MPDKELKILLFSSLFPNAVDPVFGVFVENRLRHFRADTGHQAVVVAPVPWFPFKGKMWGRYGKFAQVPLCEDRYGVTVHHPRYLVLPKVGMLLTPYFMYRAGLKYIRRLQKSGQSFDFIDAHYLYPDGVAASRIAAALGLPFAMTARGSDVTEIARLSKPRRMIREAAKRAARVITVSNSLRDELVTMGVSAAAVITLRNGVDADRFKPVRREDTRRSWGLTGRAVVFAGWLIDRKRVDIAVDALAFLDDDTKLVIAGEGPCSEELHARVKALGVADRVLFLGKVPPQEMAAVFSAADVLILPSEREGWANVLLEAMACGTPVVSRAVAGALDLVTTPAAGELVQGSDPRHYADAIRRVFQRGVSRADTRAYAEQFGWREISAAQEHIFLSAVEPPGEYKRH